MPRSTVQGGAPQTVTGWVPLALRPDVAELRRLRRLAAQTFTHQVRPRWLHKALVAGADRIIWRAIVLTGHRTGTLAATSTAFFVAYEETPRRAWLTARVLSGGMAPFVVPAALAAVLAGPLPQPWAGLAHGAALAIVLFVVAVLIASQGSSTVAELVRMQRRRELRRRGVRTWTAAALTGASGLQLVMDAIPHLPTSAVLTVTARDRKTAIVYRRWLTPIDHPRWLPAGDPPRALEGPRAALTAAGIVTGASGTLAR